jgi:hypothetical protein
MVVTATEILAGAKNLVNQAEELNAEAKVGSTIDALPTLGKDGNAITQPPPLLSDNISSEPEAKPVAPTPPESQDIIDAEKAVKDATAALAKLETNTVPDAAAIERAKATLKTATDKLTELNAAAAPIGGRRHSKRRHPKKGSRKSKKGGRSRKSKKGGRSRKNGSKHRKHSRAHKKH